MGTEEGLISSKQKLNIIKIEISRTQRKVSILVTPNSPRNEQSIAARCARIGDGKARGGGRKGFRGLF